VDLALTNVVGGNLLKVVAWYDNEWGYSNRLVEITADAGKILQEGTDKVIPDAQPVTDSAKEGMLPAPGTDDFLPPPVGQEANEPVHESKDEHQPVEGVPGLGTPADTLPEHQSLGAEPED